ncbi:MAG: outer membrane protein transport protein [Gammaproteobacteria bacterium]|nr:outer membrane protein transport protein [Gammaproteobacteria bacterium]
MNVPSIDSRLRVGMVAALGLGLAGQANASGFMIVEQSVHEVGRAISGATAGADNLGTLFFNPAGITRIEGTQGSAALHVIMPSAEFQGSGTTNIPASPGLPISGGNSETDEVGLVPNLYLVTDFDDRIKYGLGINAPFGLVTEYDPDWVGRYHAIRSELASLNINPTVAYRVDDRLSLGFGLSAVYTDVELTNAVDGVLAATSLGFCPGLPVCAVPPGSGAADGLVRLEGNDWGFGFNLGLLYELDDATRVGVAYRSRIDHTLEGESTTSVLGLQQVELIEADLTLPDTLSVGVVHRYGPRWAVLADVAWTNWSEFDELRVVSRTDGGTLLTQPENWDDTWRYSLGIEFSPDTAWTWRGGVAFDETPIPSAELRTPRVPGEDRTWLSLGFSWAPSEKLQVDFAYAHLFVDDSRIDNVDASFGYTLTGEYENSVDIVSAQLSYRF